jgi:hypothetical protein
VVVTEDTTVFGAAYQVDNLLSLLCDGRVISVSSYISAFMNSDTIISRSR